MGRTSVRSLRMRAKRYVTLDDYANNISACKFVFVKGLEKIQFLLKHFNHNNIINLELMLFKTTRLTLRSGNYLLQTMWFMYCPAQLLHKFQIIY